MGGHAQRRLFAGSEEVRNVFHLDEWHCRLLELDGTGYGQIYKPTNVSYTYPAAWYLFRCRLTCIIRSRPLAHPAGHRRGGARPACLRSRCGLRLLLWEYIYPYAVSACPDRERLRTPWWASWAQIKLVLVGHARPLAVGDEETSRSMM